MIDLIVELFDDYQAPGQSDRTALCATAFTGAWHPGMGAGLLTVKNGFILFIKSYQFPLQINTLERERDEIQDQMIWLSSHLTLSLLFIMNSVNLVPHVSTWRGGLRVLKTPFYSFSWIPDFFTPLSLSQQRDPRSSPFSSSRKFSSILKSRVSSILSNHPRMTETSQFITTHGYGGLTISGNLKSFEGPVLKCRDSRDRRALYVNELVIHEIRNNTCTIVQKFLFHLL